MSIHAKRAIARVLAAGAFLAANTGAFALGPGEMAFTARSGGKFIDEVRVMDSQSSRYPRSSTCSNGVTYWFGDYQMGKSVEWENAGCSVTLEWVDMSGKRHLVCRLL